jgi:(E)-4-hydroxy-3-methyl-but-2-enyl pyrophosphate reductase
MDEDGYIFITGRKKSVIVLENGKNVFPEEIEEYLATVPCIAESVVVGRKKQDSDAVILTAIVFPNFSEFPEGTSVEEIQAYEKEIKEHKKVGVVVQTTQMLSTLNNIVEYLNSIAKEIVVHNTICQSTAKRQSEAKEIAKTSDLMVVVGSKKSANTTHLAEILKDITKTIHIENDSELESNFDFIKNAKEIGITAGASTPENIIKNVVNKIKKGK